MIRKPIDQSIKLVNWNRLVSANRWSVDNHTKTVHRLLSIGTAPSNRRRARWKTDTRGRGVEEKEESIVLLLTFKALKWNVQPICNQSILIDINLFIDCHWKSIPIDNHTNLRHRLVIDYQYQSINWHRLVLIDIDCHRLFKSHVYAKHEFVPRDQVFPLIVVYCLLILHKNK